MKKVKARTLLNYSTAELWDILYCDFILLFDDGVEITTTWQQALYSSYAWEFHRLWPLTPLLSRHHVKSIIKNGSLMASTHIKLLSVIYFDLVEAYNLFDPIDRDDMTRMVYQITNEIYNDLIIKTEEHVLSIDILDFIEVTQHPLVKETLDKQETTQEYVEDCYEKLKALLNDKHLLSHNPLVKSVRAGIVTTHQLLQCVGPRGRVTEVDSLILTQAVSRGFVKGMRTIYNLVAESRTAAKALYLSDADLKDAEYFARRLQLLTMVVERLHYEDCGSTNYITWRVKPPIVENGVVIYPGDLTFLEGKYYITAESNKLRVISKSDTHLFNHHVKLRSVLTCIHPDKAGVCAVCFGQLADNVMPGTNIGHNCSATMTEQTTQSTLGAKHIQASSQSESIILGAEGRKWFVADKKGTNLYVKKDLKNTYLKLVVSQTDAFGLMDIDVIKDINDLNPSRITKLDYISIKTSPEEALLPICVSQKGRFPVLSAEFLKYVKDNRWEVDINNNFVFDITKWDRTKPIINLTEMEYSFARNSREIAAIIESRMKDIGDRLKQESPVYTLIELFDLVNTKLYVNIALLEVIIYASMIRNGADEDYALARGSDSASMGVADKTMGGRSLSASYGFELQQKIMFNPMSFFKLNRPDEVFDVLIDPKGVMEYLEKQKLNK
jgi:hypothetical protein